jgi:hypothetical protein
MPFDGVEQLGAELFLLRRAERRSARIGSFNALRFAEWRPFRADDHVVVTISQGCALGYRMTPRCGYARRMRRRPEEGPKGA